MEKIKEGDIVQLKSGGPKMTVKTYHSDEEIFCQWFSGSKLQNGYFDLHSLKKEEE